MDILKSYIMCFMEVMVLSSHHSIFITKTINHSYTPVPFIIQQTPVLSA